MMCFIICILVLFSAALGNGQDTTTQETTTKSSIKGKCFCAEDTVITNVGILKMSELVKEKQIQVLSHNSKTGQFEMSPIIYWIHANPAHEAKFILLSTESGHKLHISDLHLIYVSDCVSANRTVFAKMVRRGHCLFVKNEGDDKLIQSKVIEIEEISKVGIYAPLTENGNIVVNNVLASCYTNFNDVKGQKLAFSFVLRAKYLFELMFPKSFVNLVYNNTFSSNIGISDLYLALGVL